MSEHKNDLESQLDRGLSQIENSRPEAEQVKVAADRVWDRLSADSAHAGALAANETTAIALKLATARLSLMDASPYRIGSLVTGLLIRPNETRGLASCQARAWMGRASG